MRRKDYVKPEPVVGIGNIDLSCFKTKENIKEIINRLDSNFIKKVETFTIQNLTHFIRRNFKLNNIVIKKQEILGKFALVDLEFPSDIITVHADNIVYFVKMGQGIIAKLEDTIFTFNKYQEPEYGPHILTFNHDDTPLTILVTDNEAINYLLELMEYCSAISYDEKQSTITIKDNDYWGIEFGQSVGNNLIYLTHNGNKLMTIYNRHRGDGNYELDVTTQREEELYILPPKEIMKDGKTYFQYSLNILKNGVIQRIIKKDSETEVDASKFGELFEDIGLGTEPHKSWTFDKGEKCNPW